MQDSINILNKSNRLPFSWFKCISLSGQNSTLHARILGLLARLDLEEGWIIDIERSLKPNIKGRNQFKPDIVAWNSNQEIGAIIEYESVNSSDSRIYYKDLINYRNYVKKPCKDDGLPIIWVIITTLLNGPVKGSDWSKWDWRNWGEKFSKYDGKWDKLLKSPFKFWRDHYIGEFESAFKSTKVKCPLCWMNIDGGKVNIEFFKIA